MIRRRLANTKRSENVSGQPQRRRISEIPPPSVPQDERDLSDDELEAKLRDSFRAEQIRLRNMIRQVITVEDLMIMRKALEEHEQQRTTADSIAS